MKRDTVALGVINVHMCVVFFFFLELKVVILILRLNVSILKVATNETTI